MTPLAGGLGLACSEFSVVVGLVEEIPDLTVTTREVRTSVAGRNRLPKSRIKMAAKPSSKATGNNHAYERYSY